MKEIHPEKAVTQPQVVQSVVTPKKKKVNNAVIGSIETETKQKVTFEPVFLIEDSILQASEPAGPAPDKTTPETTALLPIVIEVPSPIKPARLPERLKGKDLQRAKSMVIQRNMLALPKSPGTPPEQPEEAAPLPATPARTFRNINSDDYKQKIEQLRTEGGSYWLRIYREMQGDGAPPRRRERRFSSGDLSGDINNLDNDNDDAKSMIEHQGPPVPAINTNPQTLEDYQSFIEASGYGHNSPEPAASPMSQKLALSAKSDKSWFAGLHAHTHTHLVIPPLTLFSLI